jgi:hypothetical protein
VKGPGTVNGSPETIADPNRTGYPHRTGLNTAPFSELWRAFVNVLSDDTEKNTTYPKPPKMAVPWDTSGGGGNNNAAMFRNSLRPAGSGGPSQSSAGKPGNNGAATAFDSNNMLMLRAALAAANVEALRYSNTHGNTSGTVFQPDIVRRYIQLKTTNGTLVDVMVYGVGMQPYIAEVYADNDTTDHKDPMGNVQKNPNGLIAIKLFNPYPSSTTIDMSGWSIMGVDRSGAPPMTVTPIDMTGATPKSNLKLSGGNYVVLTNWDPNAAGGAAGTALYWPQTLAKPGAANVVTIPELSKFLDTATNKMTEFMLMRPIQASLTTAGSAEVPVDAFDFAGFPAPPPGGGMPQMTATYWHYSRDVDDANPDKRWRFVYPGVYDGSQATKRFGTAIDETSYDPTDPTLPKSMATYAMSAATTTGSTNNPYGPIQLCNTDFGGFNKKPASNKATFPYGGFARVADVLQAPFIGSYIVLPVGGTLPAPGQPWPVFATGGAPPSVIEMNPVTMDCLYADDGDQNDDKIEQVGRFVPLVLTTVNPPINDYYPYGVYHNGAATGTDNAPMPASETGTRPEWRYRFAAKILEQFTTVTNTADDNFPNVDPNTYTGTPPREVPQSTGSANSATTQPIRLSGVDDGAPVEGLVNVNTAPWRVLAAVEFLPPGKAGGGTTNETIAKGIVYFRDVNDGRQHVDVKGNTVKRGHGPFRSLIELNGVWDTANNDQTKTFQNAWGLMTVDMAATKYPGADWGNFVPYGPTNAKTGSAVPNGYPTTDFIANHLMVDRVSNLLTVRSDSFTVYVVVQGWRKVNTAFPELVVQKRLAATVDRSHLQVYSPLPGAPTMPVVRQIPTK